MWRTLITSRTANQVVTVLYCSVTYFVPLAITLATFINIQSKLKSWPVSSTQKARREAEIKLSRMGGLVALFLAICFIPNQMSYILSKFGATDISSPQHKVTVVLSMLNSCVNPFVYCVTSRSYRKEFKKILFSCRHNKIACRMQLENTINVNLAVRSN